MYHTFGMRPSNTHHFCLTFNIIGLDVFRISHVFLTEISICKSAKSKVVCDVVCDVVSAGCASRRVWDFSESLNFPGDHQTETPRVKIEVN